MDISLYCICHKGVENKSSQFNQKNLMCGAVNYPPEYKEYIKNKNYLLDDKGDNISHLNPFFGQLCGLYWSWKNDQSEWVGINTYRIFWDTQELSNKIKKNNIFYIPESFYINDIIHDPLLGNRNMNLYEQYQFYHGSIGWDLLYGLCKTSDIPLKSEMIDELKTQHRIYPYNMFIAHRELYNKICEILFEILFKFYDKYKFILPTIQAHYNQIRLIDYLAERILHIIYTNKSYFLPNTEFEPIKMITYKHDE